MGRHGAWALGLLVGCGPSLGGETSFGDGSGGTGVGEDTTDSGVVTGGVDTWNSVTTGSGGTMDNGADSTGPVATSVSVDSSGSGDSVGASESGESTGSPANAPNHAADCMLAPHVESVIGQPELHVIGVYEASGDHSMAAPATVHVDRPGEVYLAVLSYEQVTWTVTAGADTTITEVTIGGSGPSSANAPMGATVDNQSAGGGLSSSHDWDDRETPGIIATLEAQTGVALTSFAGCYQGTDFTID